MSAGFAHLHCHTEYSVLDGACRIGEILQRCRDFDMKACAITDHGVLFGAVEFFQQAKKMGVKPIIGCELYLAPDSRFERTKRDGEAYYHFLTLCENETGYHNLCKLSSLGFLEGFYYKPRVDVELLAKYSEGLIATTSCLAGEVPQALLDGNMDAANEALKKYLDIFGKDNFLVELMDHGMPEQKRVNPLLAELAEHHGLMMIATNDCHYLNKDDSEPHEALLCIQTNGKLDDDDHFKFATDEVYFKSPDEMRALFPQWPDAIANTEKIADRCNVEIPLGQHLIPEFVPPEGESKLDYLKELVSAGLVERYGESVPAEYLERADFEIGVIDKMGFVDYFLVVWDLIAYARSEGIAVGPGRGSGAGSLVAYALKITNIDPMRYDLLFERFLNPERVSMPDFDIDFCYVRREEMIEYARRKYGEANVSQIITFGRMLAKAVVRDVGRVLNMPYAEADRIAKLIPDELKISLDDAYAKEPELKRLVDTDPQVGRLWRLARRLEGTIRNCGTHAAGVVICDKPLTDYVALYQAAGTSAVATQVEMKCVEEVGLLKMDFLGLRTLTVVHETVRLIREAHDVDIDIDNIPTDNQKAYALLRSGKTTGIFQLESSGMRDLAKKIGLESLEEICALVALYRPGPMEFIPTYVANKFNPEKIAYAHPLLEPILKETYGIAVYQEQVMQMVQALAGFSLGQADVLRRAMGKKKADLMAEQRAAFVQGCKETNGIEKELAEELFNVIETFAGYGFNKSHSMAYAFVAYQTAYLKANYPAEFMAALLTSESGNLDKVALYVDEARQIGIEVLPPDVNRSRLQFTVDEQNRVNFGLVAVKHVGEAPARAIVAERDANGRFADVFDFCARLDSQQVNSRLIESLNKAGAFESTGWNRAQVEASVSTALGAAQSAQRDRQAGQTNLFDALAQETAEPMRNEPPDVPEWPDAQKLAAEKEMLGLFVSSDPLEKYRPIFDRYTDRDFDDLSTLKEGHTLMLGGMIGGVKLHTTAKGKRMAFLTLNTSRGPYEMTVFSDAYEKYAELLEVDRPVLVATHVNYRNDEAGLIADDLIPVEDAERKLTRALHVALDVEQMSNGAVDKLAQLLGNHPGTCDVYLHCDWSDGRKAVVHATSSCKVRATPTLRDQAAKIVGESRVWFSAGRGLPSHGQAA
jgi:DNA polymerase III subunit alpha